MSLRRKELFWPGPEKQHRSDICPKWGRPQKNLFEILLNQTEIRLYLPFSNWFGTKQMSSWFQIDRTMKNTILFRFHLIQFRKDFSVCTVIETSDETSLSYWGVQDGPKLRPPLCQRYFSLSDSQCKFSKPVVPSQDRKSGFFLMKNGHNDNCFWGLKKNPTGYPGDWRLSV